MAYIALGDDHFNCSNGVLTRVADKALTKVAPTSTLRPLLEDTHMYGALELDGVPISDVEQLLDAVHESLHEWLAAPPLASFGQEGKYADPWYEGISLRLNELSDKLVRYIIRRKITAEQSAPTPLSSQP